MQIEFQPLGEWPRPFTRGRKDSTFRAGYKETQDLLDRELRHLGARNIALQVALEPRDIRRDGYPRADARPMKHPGVILTFERWMPNGKKNERGEPLGTYKPFSMPCDAFTDWESNLRAIGLALEALRKVDRYGVTQQGEQYAGWAALPVGASPERVEAAAFVSEHSGIFISPSSTDAEALEKARRNGMKRLHPDAGGDADLFARFSAAVEVLKR